MILKTMFAFYLSSGLSLVISSPLSEEFEMQYYGTMLSDVIGEGSCDMWIADTKTMCLPKNIPSDNCRYLSNDF